MIVNPRKKASSPFLALPHNIALTDCCGWLDGGGNIYRIDDV